MAFQTIINSRLVFAIILLIVFLLFLIGGVGETIIDITRTLNSIPPALYIMFFIFLIFLRLRKK